MKKKKNNRNYPIWETETKSTKKKENGMGDYGKNSNFYIQWVPGAKKKEDRVEKVVK